MEKKNNPWIVIAIVTAILAAVAAVVVFVLRARDKQKAWYDEEAIDCAMDDFDCVDFDEEDVEIAEVVEEE